MPQSLKRSGERKAFLIGIGDELLRGDHPDLNSPFLAKALAQAGWEIVETRILPDDLGHMAQTFRAAAERAELVVCTGGLGPTIDDLTRQAAALAAGVEIEFDDLSWSWVLEWYARSERKPPESNKRQALIPSGGVPLLNTAGTAPGLRMSLGSSTLFCLPGPPREVEPMVAGELLPWLGERKPPAEHRATKRVYYGSLSESQFADKAGALMERSPDGPVGVLVGVTAKSGRLATSITVTAATRELAEKEALKRQAQFIALFPELVYSLEDPALERVLGQELIRKGVRVSAAESCTFGMVSAALATTPGISAVLGETFCTYSDGAKSATLGVPPKVLQQHGAVSEPVVRAMALGALSKGAADLAVAVSGIAGPDGGSDDKPVGLVWFAVAWKGQVVFAEERRFPPASRERVRTWATNWALHALLRVLRQEAPDP